MKARKFHHGDADESAFHQARERHEAQAVVAGAEAYLQGIADRAARRDAILAEHGFDIGTREEAILRTGPYADQANADRVALFFLENRVGTEVIG